MHSMRIGIITVVALMLAIAGSIVSLTNVQAQGDGASGGEQPIVVTETESDGEGIPSIGSIKAEIESTGASLPNIGNVVAENERSSTHGAGEVNYAATSEFPGYQTPNFTVTAITSGSDINHGEIRLNWQQSDLASEYRISYIADLDTGDNWMIRESHRTVPAGLAPDGYTLTRLYPGIKYHIRIYRHHTDGSVNAPEFVTATSNGAAPPASVVPQPAKGRPAGVGNWTYSDSVLSNQEVLQFISLDSEYAGPDEKPRDFDITLSCVSSSLQLNPYSVHYGSGTYLSERLDDTVEYRVGNSAWVMVPEDTSVISGGWWFADTAVDDFIAALRRAETAGSKVYIREYDDWNSSFLTVRFDVAGFAASANRLVCDLP